ncbi:longitudinals lacking protein, isoforms A/B/D/L isoform X4 [Scaptodrosophila lebanonensis]|uniref:Longitudinals lacking protein, isoforms A/B/D/L isoform X4 n=1 Tax=Drosophila lebanonensis TaxID=7225 RepID=A0A6J2ULH6_DROLE|nr:longitudinals lacking protein, isoforms A/B/D/L isoform X4 [Scaptodrosophila lebanonensis]
MDDDQQFCLRWNNHQSTLISVFDTLLENETLVDCTLAAEGKFLKAHKVVLSACSPYFATLLQEQYDKHPIFILKDVKYQELRAMMDYMYRGEVNISQDQLAALLKAAESLQIKGLSDNRTGNAATAPKPESHHRGKLGGAYTLEQTKRARMATGAMDAQDVSGSREGSSSPSRRRRKVRRRSIENDAHDNSNSSVLQAAVVSNQSILQQTNTGLAASAMVATQMPASSSASNVAAASQVTTQPSSLTSTNVTKKTESAKLTSTAAQGAAATAAGGVNAGQQQQQTSDAINTDNVQTGGAQGAHVGAGGDVEDMDVVAAGGAAVHTGVVVKQLSATIEKSNHKQKNKDSSVSSAGSELVIEPKAEYDEDAHDENVEDLTLDEEDMTMEELDQTAGTSQGGEGSSQAYTTWQHDRSQDELGLMAAQDAQQRDPQDLSITRIAGLTWSEWNARLAMPLVTLREGVQPLVFPTDLSVDKQQQSCASIKLSAETSERKTPTEGSSSLKIEPSAASTPRISSNSGSSGNLPVAEKHHKGNGGGKLKHFTEEEATALMLKAVAEKQAAANNSGNLTDLSYGDDNNLGAGNGNSSDYMPTLSGAVTFADVGGAPGLCHINILNSISAMNNLISGNTGGAGGNASISLSSTLGSNSNAGSGSSNNSGADNGAGHPCPVCGRVYKLKSSLRNHQKWECGKEPQFQCPFCVYRAKQKMHIGRHMERMHKEKFKLEDVKSFTSGVVLEGDSGGSSTVAAVAAAAAAAGALAANAAELQQHFS